MVPILRGGLLWNRREVWFEEYQYVHCAHLRRGRTRYEVSAVQEDVDSLKREAGKSKMSSEPKLQLKPQSTGDA